MGSKVNPRSFRTHTTFRMPSRWFANKYEFADNLKTDVLIRKMVKTKFRDAGVARIEIERSPEEITIIIFTSKPGVVIGRGGALIEEVKAEMKRKFFGSVKMKVNISIQEVKDVDLSAELIYQTIRDQIEQRVPFRRAIKRSLEQVKRARAEGCKIQVSGRLNGADIARRESVTFGRLPLHTLRANIDYSRGVAHTTYGVIGVKVWIYTGEIFGDEEAEQQIKKKKTRRPRAKRQQLQTDGQKLILRKKVDVEKDKEKTTT